MAPDCHGAKRVPVGLVEVHRGAVLGVAWPSFEHLLGEVEVLDVVRGIWIGCSDDDGVFLLELRLVQLVLIFGDDDDGFLRCAQLSARVHEIARTACRSIAATSWLGKGESEPRRGRQAGREAARRALRITHFLLDLRLRLRRRFLLPALLRHRSPPSAHPPVQRRPSASPSPAARREGTTVRHSKTSVRVRRRFSARHRKSKYPYNVSCIDID